jgi:hypothetical protein
MNSAGIGAGHSINNGKSYAEHLTIKGGIVHAIGGSGAGIGAGSGHMTGFSYVNDLQIVGGDVSAESRYGAMRQCSPQETGQTRRPFGWYISNFASLRCQSNVGSDARRRDDERLKSSLATVRDRLT